MDEFGNFLGFDVVIGNPPYGIFNKKQNQKIALKSNQHIIDYFKRQYAPAIEGMINASKLFYLQGLNLLQNEGFQAMIIPFGILTDLSSKKIRSYLFNNHSFVLIDAFPERDNVSRRVFDEAKISTSVLVCSKQKISTEIRFGISYQKKVPTSRFKLTIENIKQLSGENYIVPLVNEQQFKLLNKIYTLPNCKLFKNFGRCLTGEIDITLAKAAISNDKNDMVLIKGVQLDRYVLKTDQDSISQGIIQFLNEIEFFKLYKGEKLKHSKSERIALQGLTGVNEKNRLKASTVPARCYLANSCNYLTLNEGIHSGSILALLNSRLLNFVFKCKSTNSNVNGYEVDDLPIILPKSTNLLDSLVKKIKNAKSKSTQADISSYENEINQIVYELYELTQDEIEMIEQF